MARVHVVLSALAGVAACSAPEDAVQERSSGIKDLAANKATAYPEVMLLDMTKDGKYSRDYRCTGVLLSRRTVLTAEHCVKGFDGWLALGVYGDVKNIFSIAESWVVRDDAPSQPSTKAYDVGILCLKGPGFPIKKLPRILWAGLHVGKKVVSVGRTSNETISDKDAFVSPQFELLKSPSHAIYGTFKFDYGGTDYLEGADSGGPTFRADLEEHIIVGVNSGGMRGSVLISKVNDIVGWINRQRNDCEDGKGLANQVAQGNGPFEGPPLPPPAQCRTAVVQASKTYHPPAWRDGEGSFLPELGFLLPSRIPVTRGNAGNQELTLSYLYREQITSCRYVGGADGPHPKSPAEMQAGLQYVFRGCTDDTGPGTLVKADIVRLHVDDGDPHAGDTEATLVLDEITTCGQPPPEDGGLDGSSMPDLADASTSPDLTDASTSPDLTDAFTAPDLTDAFTAADLTQAPAPFDLMSIPDAAAGSCDCPPTGAPCEGPGYCDTGDVCRYPPAQAGTACLLDGGATGVCDGLQATSNNCVPEALCPCLPAAGVCTRSICDPSGNPVCQTVPAAPGEPCSIGVCDGFHMGFAGCLH